MSTTVPQARVEARGTPRRPSPAAAAALGAPAVDIAIPVHNEERDLAPSIRRLRSHLDTSFPVPARITIVDSASTDSTWAIARRLRAELPGIHAVRLEQKGRGRALRAAWTTSEAAVVAYMDVDLSTDLRALPPLVAPLLDGRADIAIGSRLTRGSSVVRGLRRDVISRTYNRILRATLRVGFRDAQCGFKALRTDVAQRLLPRVEDQAWFFDTELLVLAERAGLRVLEVPVRWVDDADSRVRVVSTAVEDLRGIARLRRSLARDRVLAGLEDLAETAQPAGRRAAAIPG